MLNSLIRSHSFVSVSAFDRDTISDSTLNYTLASTDGVFALDSHSGRISLLTPLDRETKEVYEITGEFEVRCFCATPS